MNKDEISFVNNKIHNLALDLKTNIIDWSEFDEKLRDFIKETINKLKEEVIRNEKRS